MKWLYAGLFLLFGIAALWAAFRVSGDIKRGRSWPTTPGKILERKVGEPMATRNPTYMPYVKYTYTVDGKQYTNDQVYLIKRSGGRVDKIQKLVDGLPDPIDVHYNPKDPSQAFLLTNPTSTSWILVAFGALAVLMGLGQLLMILTKKTGASP